MKDEQTKGRKGNWRCLSRKTIDSSKNERSLEGIPLERLKKQISGQAFRGQAFLGILGMPAHFGLAGGSGLTALKASYSLQGSGELM